MDFDVEKMLEMMEQAKKTFVCLRCGECCFAWAVKMPDGSIKPDRHTCCYLTPRRKEGGKWLQASCQIHEAADFPWECREAILGSWLCPLGLATWNLVQGQNPGDELPEIVQQALAAWRQIKGGENGGK